MWENRHWFKTCRNLLSNLWSLKKANWFFRLYTIFKDLHGSGHFRTEMQLFIGNSPIPKNFSVSASEDVLIEVGMQRADNKLKVVLTDCWATPTFNSLDPLSFVFISNRYSNAICKHLSHTFGLTVVLTNNVLYFKCLLHVFSPFTCMVPFYLAWLHLFWTRKVDMKRDFKGPWGSFLSLAVFLTILWGYCTFNLKESLEGDFGSQWKSIWAVGALSPSLWFRGFSVVSALSRAYVPLVTEEIGYLIPHTWY